MGKARADNALALSREYLTITIKVVDKSEAGHCATVVRITTGVEYIHTTTVKVHYLNRIPFLLGFVLIYS